MSRCLSVPDTESHIVSSRSGLTSSADFTTLKPELHPQDYLTLETTVLCPIYVKRLLSLLTPVSHLISSVLKTEGVKSGRKIT